MVTYVLDASAVLRLVDQEPGSERLRDILLASAAGACNATISAINWGEVTYTLAKRPHATLGLAIAYALFDQRMTSPVASSKRAERAGALKLRYRIPYVDAFALELASDSPDHILVTADFDFKPAEQDIRIEFLPAKSK